jgi:hypothetical protein
MSSERVPPALDPDVPPPILGSWRNLYVLLVVESGALIAFFYALTWWAS